MNMIKIALLGTAAIAAVSVGAQASTASDIAALKAQINALSAQVAANQASAQIPAGFELVALSMQPAITIPGDAPSTALAHTIAIMPTADAPATTSIQWSGLARAALVYTNKHTTWNGGSLATPAYIVEPDVNGTHIKARGQLDVVGKTDTAVGEVGVAIELRGNFDGAGDASVIMNKAIGWWALTPNLSLRAGYEGMTGGVGGYGTDILNALYTDSAPNSAGTPGDTTQFALAYSDGPIGFKVAVGHYDGTIPDLSGVQGFVTTTANSDFAFGAQAEFKGDSMSAKVAGFVHGNDYQVGVGATASMDMFSLSAAAAIGKDANHTFIYWGTAQNATEDATYWNANLFAGAKLSDSVSAEIGGGYNNYQGATFGGSTLNSNKWGVAGGIYYSPVSQLTIGAEASWNKEHFNGANTGVWTGDDTTVAADLVTVFKF